MGRVDIKLGKWEGSGLGRFLGVNGF